MVEVASITNRDYEARNNENWRTAVLVTDRLGAPVDLTGTTWAMHLRRNGRALLDLDISSANGRIFLGDDVGTIGIEVNESAVTGLSGIYLYDLKETVSNRVIQAGMISVIDGETRGEDSYASV